MKDPLTKPDGEYYKQCRGLSYLDIEEPNGGRDDFTIVDRSGHPRVSNAKDIGLRIVRNP